MNNDLKIRLIAFLESAKELNKAWEESDHTGGLISHKYPFAASFDDVVTDISEWVEYHITDKTETI